MSKVMSILGIVVAVLGAFLGFSNWNSPGQMQVVGLTYDVAAILFVGGLICLGLGGVIAALGRVGFAAPIAEAPYIEAPAVEAIVPEVTEAPAAEPAKFNGFGRKAAVAAAATTAVVGATAAAAAKPASDSVAETIAALEKAKTDINNALGGAPETYVAPDAPAAEVAEEIIQVAVAPEADVEADAEVGEDGELFVVEEKIIRGRPARVLSDGTVEAETDEGWMRFENLEHLDEYLDATANDEA